MRHRLTARDMAYIAVFAALISLCSWLSIPTLVPITLQTFAVFLTVFLLGGRRGALCVAVYLLLGGVGLPVFSFFRGGPAALLGASGGYLLGFLPCALILWLSERWTEGHLLRRFFASLTALAALYLSGTLWYAMFYLESTPSPGALLASCVLPFILPDLLKLSLALFLSYRLKKQAKPHFTSGHL